MANYAPNTWTSGDTITKTKIDRLEAGAAAALPSADAPELIRDTIGTALVAGSNVTITPNDGADTITIAAATGGGSSGWTVLVSVTADGATDASTTIQAVLDGLATTSSRSYEVIVEPAYPRATSALIYLNNKVRITTSHTKVRFKAPVLLGTGCDPDGQGCLSILGTQTGTQTVTASTAVRGKTVITVGSTTGLATRQMVRIFDNATTGGASAGYRTEMAEIIEISGTSVTLDHPLHHTYTGTVTLGYFANPPANSGFEDVYATFSGQQPAAFLFPAKMQYARGCYMRNCHFRGDPSNSWARECLNVRWSYRCVYDNCSATFSWDNAVGSEYSYGFSDDGSTGTTYLRCVGNALRHAFTADKGAAGTMYSQCVANMVMASGFDLHGSWARDIMYVECVATGAPDGRKALDGTNMGFLAGNTTFLAGNQNISYVGCVARNFVPYTPSGGGSGDGAGFGVVDGSSNISYQSCRVYDSEIGIQIVSLDGAAISNVVISDVEFNNISSSDPSARPPVPIQVSIAAAPNGLTGLIVDGCKVINSPTTAAMQIFGTSGNPITDVAVTNNTWLLSQGVSGAPSLECQYVTRLVVADNTFSATRRGVGLANCVGAIVTGNKFLNLTEPGNCIRDSGGNTSMVFAKNFIFPAPTAHGVTPTSTGAFIDITGPTNTPTASRPALTAGTVGPTIYNPTTSRLEVWTGTTWVGATEAPVTVNAQTGTAYTLALADAGKVVECTNAAANTVTVPPNSSVAFPVGTIIEVAQLGAGQTTIAAGAGVTIRTPATLALRTQYATASLRKTATDTWLVAGDLA